MKGGRKEGMVSIDEAIFLTRQEGYGVRDQSRGQQVTVPQPNLAYHLLL